MPVLHCGLALLLLYNSIEAQYLRKDFFLHPYSWTSMSTSCKPEIGLIFFLLDSKILEFIFNADVMTCGILVINRYFSPEWPDREWVKIFSKGVFLFLNICVFTIEQIFRKCFLKMYVCYKNIASEIISTNCDVVWSVYFRNYCVIELINAFTQCKV